MGLDVEDITRWTSKQEDNKSSVQIVLPKASHWLAVTRVQSKLREYWKGKIKQGGKEPEQRKKTPADLADMADVVSNMSLFANKTMWIFTKNYHPSLQNGRLCWETKYENTVSLGERKMPMFRLSFHTAKAEAGAQGEPSHALVAPLHLCSGPHWGRDGTENGPFSFYSNGFFFSWVGCLGWFTKQPPVTLHNIPKCQWRRWQE